MYQNVSRLTRNLKDSASLLRIPARSGWLGSRTSSAIAIALARTRSASSCSPCPENAESYRYQHEQAMMVTVSLDRPAYVGGQLVVAQDERTHQNPAGSCSHTRIQQDRMNTIDSGSS